MTSGFTICGLLAGLVILLVPFLLAWLVWSRYLYHKETMKLAEMGGDARPALEMRERWRLRWGMLAGAAMTVGGSAGAMGLVVYLNLKALSSARPQFAQRTAMIDTGGLAVLLALSLLLMILGAVTLVAYSTWGRRQPTTRPTREEESARERWRMRRGMLGGATLILLGCAILAMVPAASELIRESRDAEHYFGVAGFVVIATGLLVLILHAMWGKQDAKTLEQGGGRKSDDAGEAE